MKKQLGRFGSGLLCIALGAVGATATSFGWLFLVTVLVTLAVGKNWGMEEAISNSVNGFLNWTTPILAVLGASYAVGMALEVE